jgi:hypothetical protein
LIYHYLCNQCLSPLMLWVRIPPRRGVFDITFCHKVCQWLATGRGGFLRVLRFPSNPTEMEKADTPIKQWNYSLGWLVYGV